MKKIPTLFERDWNGDRSRVIAEPNPACLWVFAGEGLATRKLDGSSCLVRGGALFKRRELSGKQAESEGFELVTHDETTGKRVGWMPVGDSAEDAWHREALAHAEKPLADGTYELLGPKVQGNLERLTGHELWPHSEATRFADVPLEFEALREWLTGRDIEGLVWHHPDGRMAKIKLRDFGLHRPKREGH
jgi:hypothetical protein